MSKYVVVLLFTLLAPVLSQTPDGQCFWKASNQVIAEAHPGWFVCNNTAITPGGARLCCIQGSKCGEDSICHWPQGSQGGTGYYLGGCTDGSYRDNVCPRSCTSYSHTFIRWNRTEQLWHCCGDDAYTCNNNTPTEETFQAVSPGQWSALPSTATSTPTSTGSSGNSSRTGNAGNGNNGSNNNGGKSSGGLSVGAQAGIGVACGLAGVAIIGGLIFFLLTRKRKHNNNVPTSDEKERVSDGGQQAPTPAPAYATPADHHAQEYKAPLEQQHLGYGEMSAGQLPPQELEGEQTEPRELPGSVVQR